MHTGYARLWNKPHTSQHELTTAMQLLSLAAED